RQHMFTEYNSFVLHYPPSIYIHTLSLHDALPIFGQLRIPADAKLVKKISGERRREYGSSRDLKICSVAGDVIGFKPENFVLSERSEEHTSELQSRENIVCRLLLEKKKMKLQN